MICERCGHTAPDRSLYCDNCGAYLGRLGGPSSTGGGVQNLRQGRSGSVQPSSPDGRSRSEVREYGDYDMSPLPVDGDEPRARLRPIDDGAAIKRLKASRPDTRRGLPVTGKSRPTPRVAGSGKKIRRIKHSRINLMIVLVVLVVLALGGFVANYLYMNKSEEGMRITARKNVLAADENLLALAVNTRDTAAQTEREALLKKWNGVSADNYRMVGQEYLDDGDVNAAIMAFRIADILGPKHYDGLLSLASAYELNGDDAAAEALYIDLTELVSDSRSEAYTALIRMYQEQGRRPEAADIMLKAYQNTDRETFRLQRRDYIPQPPQINLEAGRYQINKLESDVYLTSPQDFDIYYTTDDNATLPEDGVLSINGEIIPREGSITLRAVCVSGDLKSDELRVSYTFFYPTPPAPKANLAPNTYDRRYAVDLRPGTLIDDTRTNKERKAEEALYKYYFTIDGSIPTEDSPIYDGTSIQMPSGRVTLRAICVNQYGKMSSTMEIGYKFNVKPDPLKVYSISDTFTGFELETTSMDNFIKTFGQPTKTENTVYLNLPNNARRLSYGWGSAVFVLDDGLWGLFRLEMTTGFTDAPRSVGLGSTESEVCAAYKDFGQPQSPDGTRGLYYDYPRVGSVLVAEDGSRMVQYTCDSLTSKTWVLQYCLSNGYVNRIIHYAE